MRTWCASLMLIAVCASAQEPSGNLSSPMGKPPEARAAAAQPVESKPAKAGKTAVKVEKIVVAAGVKDREAFGVADQEQVELRVDGERGAVFSNVVCRVHPSFALECHLDFDEGNAVGIASGAFGQVIRRHS